MKLAKALSQGFVLNKLAQVIIAVVLFNACYMAETVRAGLQAIPKGQFEGAHTIGLGYWGTMGLIIMPQALKHMIPNIVSSLIGLFDLLGMLRSISKDVPWLGLHKEPLIFGAGLFFIMCFSMSKYSRHLGSGPTSFVIFVLRRAARLVAGVFNCASAKTAKLWIGRFAQRPQRPHPTGACSGTGPRAKIIKS